MSHTIPLTFATLKSHSIFIPPISTSSPPEDEWELLDRSSADEPMSQKHNRMVMRDKDLIVAVDSEVRMTSVHASDGSWKVENGLVGSYRTLKSSHLTFAIHRVVVNPTGRLLAVVGHHQIVVLVLPKPTYSGKLEDGQVEVESIPIDDFLFSRSSDDAITQVQWHRWGENGNSLWVLTASGKLREYDVLQPHDCVQTFDFIPERGRSVPKFTAVDPLSRYASSFAFGASMIGFSPLMVYCLLASGDIHVLGPILPLRTEMPAQYLRELKTFMDIRLGTVQNQARDVFGAGTSGLGKTVLQAEWVDHLVKQVRQTEEIQSKKQVEEEGGTTQHTPMGVSISGKLTKPHSYSVEVGSSSLGLPRNGFVRIHPPHLTESGGPAPGAHRALLRQGPVVFSPGPQDVGNVDEDLDEEQMATDLLIMQVGADNTEAGGSKKTEEQTVIAIAWSGGRVDIGLELDAPEARWVSSRDPTPPPPMIHITDSILLSFPNSDPFIISSNAPVLARDPLYSDVFYVSHSFGVDSINVRPVVDGLDGDGDEGELPPPEVLRLVESNGVPNAPIVGLFCFCNITFGYGIVALASTGQVAYIELDIRCGDPLALLSGTTRAANGFEAELKDTQSLLDNVFDADSLVSSVKTGSKALSRQIPDYSMPLTVINSDHLSALQDISSHVHAQAQRIRAASQTVENRLDLQVQELQLHARLLAQCRQDVSDLQKSETLDRIESLIRRQESIQKRVEKMLAILALEYKPFVGYGERRWFKELEEMEMKLNGDSEKVEETLTDKAQSFQNQLALLLPAVSKAYQRESAAVATLAPKQIKPLKAALGARSEELKRLLNKIEALDISLDTASVE
ncbi:hypothetical protein I314_01120 [Cryptococcus bacillisporus CA1873]|uniref:Nucleoporin Nup82 n=1 Tax=Cryptococcus bacillisporus CA1873 TaxID=1296111 RepID=A0ABR5BHP2_CRYGA|nr:hypothetical protein I314_01120 [Cryptococcus bacillisporus CA1873]|eukprot:KIR68697.1 hypothetical protein I314_01120 [Cryptococcus gattii CA1873]